MIREYLCSVTSAAIISSCISSISNSFGSTTAKLIKMLAGTFISLTVFAPLAEIDLGSVDFDFRSYTAEAQLITAEAQNDIAKQQQAVIKEQLEAYVFYKAESLGCTLSVCVELNKEPPYPPAKIILEGKISPYAKNTLSKIITTDLGIPPEAQTWSN